MTSIAQRRVAGATALMILLYLMQVVLLPVNARAASVEPQFIAGTANQTCTQLLGPGNWTEVKFDPNGDGTIGPVTVSDSQDDKTFDWSSTVEIDAVFVKAGAEGSNLYVYSPPSLGDTDLVSPGETGNGISHIAFCYDPTPTFQIDPCDTDTGTHDVTFTVRSNHDLTITTVVDGSQVKVGDYGAGTHTVALGEGTYNWFLYSPPNSGSEVMKGSFAVGQCDIVTTTTAPTTTTTAPPTTTTTAPPTTTTTAPPTTTTTAPPTTTQPPVTTTQPPVTTTQPPVTTTIPFDSVPEEAEVLGTTITVAPAEVSADTLPFTGFESEDTLKLGALSLLAGLLMLFAVRGPKEQEEASTPDMGGWSNH